MPSLHDDLQSTSSRRAGKPRMVKGTAGESRLVRLQRLAGNSGVAQLIEGEQQRSPVKDIIGSGGQPLDSQTQDFMESRLGHDFSDVRVHTGSEAARSADSVTAQAYTVGTDIVFNEGNYSPDTPEGARMLAHELTHVVQQKSGPVDGNPAPGGINVSDPSDRFEKAAEQTADRVVSGRTPPSPASARTSSVQREAEEGQMLAIQRQRGVEEELLEEEEEKAVIMEE